MCSPPDCIQWEQIEGECCDFHCIEPPDHGVPMDVNGTYVDGSGTGNGYFLYIREQGLVI